jgi:hypothetical protein
LRQDAIQSLNGGIWHTTSSDHFEMIVAQGFIKIRPDISEHERWKSSKGAEYYSFVRTIGGVSLFDFCGFDATQYSIDYPFSSWHEFVPICSKWNSSVWIEIDLHKIKINFVSGIELLQRWKDENAYQHAIMPKIEACCLQDVPVSAFLRNLKFERPITATT